MADSDDDWENEDIPTISRISSKPDAEEDLTVIEMEAAAAAAPSLPRGPTEAEIRRDEVIYFFVYCIVSLHTFHLLQLIFQRRHHL